MTPDASILVLNCGSSSVKFAVYEVGAIEASDPSAAQPVQAALRGQISGLPASARLDWHPAEAVPVREALSGVSDHASALAWLFDRLDHSPRYRAVGAVGHRVVHGGERFAEPVVVDEAILAALEAQVPLAPLHQPHNLAGIRAGCRALGSRAGDVKQVACFDTAFHTTQPALHTTFALPLSMRERGVRRYGFHGLSYQSIAERLPAIAGERAEGRVIVAHLGNGASVCGLRARRSHRTSMGMTALDGLVMGSRPGSLDIGVALFALSTLAMSVEQLSHLLYNESGLLGLSGISNDVRTLLGSIDPRAALALEIFCERAAQEIAATAVALGGCDMLVFTAGIGENSPAIREAIVRRLAFMGAALDASANSAGGPLLSTPQSAIEVRAIPTDEESVIARSTLAAVRAAS